MTRTLVSVVVPVRNEHENIRTCLRRLEGALRNHEHEILVVYDRDDDTTLEAIRRLAPAPAHVRLVKNTLGPSPSFAIRAGIAAAGGDVIAVSMADLSDPPEAILEMAKKIRNGADVVSGSRYMRGGSQTGGPFVKTLLSRAAGLSLAWIAGVHTHDATTSFRAFSRRFVDAVPLESRTGFTFGIEATVKAHANGFVVDEVPSSWADRTAGESNFRVAKWLGAYLAWYFSAMRTPLVVWAAWLVELAVALGGPEAGVVGRGSPALGLFAILAARRLRGRMSLVDVAIPLCLLAPILEPRAGIAASAAALVAALLAFARSGRIRRRMAGS